MSRLSRRSRIQRDLVDDDLKCWNIIHETEMTVELANGNDIIITNDCSHLTKVGVLHL